MVRAHARCGARRQRGLELSGNAVATIRGLPRRTVLGRAPLRSGRPRRFWTTMTTARTLAMRRSVEVLLGDAAHQRPLPAAAPPFDPVWQRRPIVGAGLLDTDRALSSRARPTTPVDVLTNPTKNGDVRGR
jgi:hypothetical protein